MQPCDSNNKGTIVSNIFRFSNLAKRYTQEHYLQQHVVQEIAARLHRTWKNIPMMAIMASLPLASSALSFFLPEYGPSEGAQGFVLSVLEVKSHAMRNTVLLALLTPRWAGIWKRTGKN